MTQGTEVSASVSAFFDRFLLTIHKSIGCPAIARKARPTL